MHLDTLVKYLKSNHSKHVVNFNQSYFFLLNTTLHSARHGARWEHKVMWVGHFLLPNHALLEHLALYRVSHEDD